MSKSDTVAQFEHFKKKEDSTLIIKLLVETKFQLHKGSQDNSSLPPCQSRFPDAIISASLLGQHLTFQPFFFVCPPNLILDLYFFSIKLCTDLGSVLWEINDFTMNKKLLD